ncbi:MAG: hypothetical protein M3R65_11405 [Gemmatimonadota bacterium]|nr:hypothetical protein [Gemmatimonadota bacterium]
MGIVVLLAQIGIVQFQTRVAPDTVFVGQQVNYDAATLVDDVARRRLRSNPVFTPADVAGATLYDFPFDTAAITNVTVNGVSFRRYGYHRAMFPLLPGTYTVPAASLRYSLPDADDYFSPPRTFTTNSQPATFTAIPLPLSGRPVAFSGAVGEFHDTLQTDGASPRVGDPFTITMRISGAGNLRLLPRPMLQVDWASVVPGDERVAWDSAGTVVRGAKEFDWVVTPRIAGDMVLPAVRYDYFNPVTRRYEIAMTPSLPMAVAAATVAAAHAPAPRDSIGDTPFPAMMRFARSNSLVIAIAASAIAILLLGMLLFRRRSDAPEDED